MPNQDNKLNLQQKKTCVQFKPYPSPESFTQTRFASLATNQDRKRLNIYLFALYIKGFLDHITFSWLAGNDHMCLQAIGVS